MARNLIVGQAVYVPWSRLGLDQAGASALTEATVAEVVGRQVVLNLPGGAQSKTIGSSLVHEKDAAVLVVRIGDFATEPTLLDPLAKSLLQYLRLLLPDDAVRILEIRSLAELDQAWPINAPAFTNVVLVGHGSTTGVTFGVDGSVTADTLAPHLTVDPARKWSFLSLCCQTGYAGFSKALSRTAVCREIIAPFHSVHGAIASQFAQSYFGYHFVQGETPSVAFRHARKATPGAVSFRLWRNGTLSDAG
ncbi:MAG TPA: hypothetical protein VJO34_13840 [Methylomirabilota bacterium]|nr:hypothetical protein [Methylomirabilota bacterium]